MLCSYLCGIVRILVRDLIQINGFFRSLPPPQIHPPWPRTVVLCSGSASNRIWGMHFFLTFDLNEARFLMCLFWHYLFYSILKLDYKERIYYLKKPISVHIRYRDNALCKIQLLITYSIVKIALTIHFKISLYPSVLHYTKWNWAYSWNIIRGHLDFFMSCVDFFCCKILIKIFPYFLSFSTRKKFPEWIYIECD